MSICKLDSNGYCERHKTIHVGYLLTLSQMDNEEGEKYRQLWDEQIQPGFADRAKHFAQAVINHLVAGRPKVTDHEYAARLAICNVCDHCDKSTESWQCKLCTCNLKEGFILPGKARWANEVCPDNPPRWPKIELPVVVENPQGGCPRCPGSH